MKKSRENISEETRLKLSLSQKNRIYTEEYKQIIRDRIIKISSKKIVNQGFELDIKMSEVKINEGVTDADFQ